MTKNKPLLKEPFIIKESNCTIISEQKIGLDTARDSIRRNRKVLEKYCTENSLFLNIRYFTLILKQFLFFKKN